MLISAWCDSDRLWRTTASPLAYELTCNLHAAARLAYEMWKRWEAGDAA